MPTLKETLIEFLKIQPDEIEAETIIEFVYLQQKIAQAEENIHKAPVYAHDQAKDEFQESEHSAVSKQILKTILNCRANFKLSSPKILTDLNRNPEKKNGSTVLSNILSLCENECHRYYRCDTIAEGDDYLKIIEDFSI